MLFIEILLRNLKCQPTFKRKGWYIQLYVPIVDLGRQTCHVINCQTMLHKVVRQGGNKVRFFVTDPIFVPKCLIFDSNSMTNFGPWFHKYGTSWSLIPQKPADPDPMDCDSGSHGCDPRSHPFDLWSNITRYDPDMSIYAAKSCTNV